MAELKEIDKIIDYLELDTYGLSVKVQNIIDNCIERLELYISDNGYRD